MAIYINNNQGPITNIDTMNGDIHIHVGSQETAPKKTEDVEDLMTTSANSNIKDAVIVSGEQEPVPGTKDNHVRLFMEAMKQVQQGVYCKAPFEPNIKYIYDWYAICRLATDIGIASSVDEFLGIMEGDEWEKKPQMYQNFAGYAKAIKKESRYPNWQSGNGYENFYNKFQQIADQTYSNYKAKCEQAKIEPYK